MNDRHVSPQTTESAPRSNARRWTIAGLAAATVAGLAAVGAAGWHARAEAHGPFMGRALHGEMDPESMGKRVDAMVNWMLADIDATADQRARISSIAKAAAGELAPLRKQHREARMKARQLLVAPQIDRAQLEALRTEQMQAADKLSRRVVQAMADAAEVLTPEQRAKLAQKRMERFSRRQG